MTARFAGSRSLDERRRRWLAANEMEQAAGSANVGASKPKTEEELPPAEAQLTQFPLRKIISAKGWKIACVALWTFLLGAGILALGSGEVPIPAWMQPARSRLYESSRVKLPRLFQSGLLIAGGQLALLIYWARGRSLRDFEGRYRVWLWSAFGAMFAGLSLLGDWHWALSDTVCALWSAKFPMREVVCWMLPSGLVAGILWRQLRVDMRDCRWSTAFFWLTGFALAGACIFRLEIDRTGWPMELRRLAGDSLQMLAAVSLFVSFLVHARFVLHISPEPPQLRPSLWAKLLAGVLAILRKLPKPKLKLAFLWKRRTKKPSKKPNKKTKTSTESAPSPSTEKTEDSAKKDETPARKSKKTKRQQRATEPAPKRKAEEPKPEAPPPEAKVRDDAKRAEPKPQLQTAAKQSETQTPAKAEKKESAPTEPQASESKLRVDPLDPEMLKGLSKKERRRLRKEHREAQRKNAG